MIDPVARPAGRPAVRALAARGAGASARSPRCCWRRLRAAVLSADCWRPDAHWLAWAARMLLLDLRRLQRAERSRTSPGARCWAATRRSAAASWPGAKAWAWSAWCWHRCCRCWLGLPAMLGLFALALAAGWLAWTRAPRARPHGAAAAARRGRRWHRAAAGGSRVPPPARGVRAQRHRQRDAGHAGAVLRAGPAAGAGRDASRCSWAPISSAPRCRSRCGCALVRAHRPGAHLAGRHAAGDRRVRRRRPAGRGRHGRLPGGLRAVGRGAGHRPGAAGRAAGRRDRAGRRPAAGAKARTSAGGTSRPSSTWRWPPAWRCRCSGWLGYAPGQRATRRRCRR